METGNIVRVIKDFLTTTPGELCAQKGTVLQVLEPVDKIWVKCLLEEREGLIPSANISNCDIPKLNEAHKLFAATNDFQAEQPGDLPLKRGDLVIGMSTTDSIWYRGKTLNGCREGLFPTNFCWELDPKNYIPRPYDAAKQCEVEKYAKVVHSMKAQLPEEVDLTQGDVIKIVQKIDKDWFRGISHGKTGIFPSSFVKVIDSFPGDKPPHNADITSYTQAARHRDHQYMNTENTFKGLEENLRNLIHRQDQFGPPGPGPGLPTEMFEDDYFKRNLPKSYGSVSEGPPEEMEGTDTVEWRGISLAHLSIPNSYIRS